MTTNADAPSEREEIEMLLPWYATGKLEPADADRVETYLAHHPDMRERLDLIHREQNETVFLNRPQDVGPATTAKQFMAVLAESRTTPQAASTSWWKRLFDMPASGAMRWAAAAAVLVVVVQAAAIVMLAGSRDAGTYVEATGGEQAVAAGTFILVRFTDTASAADLTELLDGLKMQIVEGPKVGGLFKLRIGPQEMSEADSERMIGALTKRSDLVIFVTATP